MLLRAKTGTPIRDGRTRGGEHRLSVELFPTYGGRALAGEVDEERTGSGACERKSKGRSIRKGEDWGVTLGLLVVLPGRLQRT